MGRRRKIQYQQSKPIWIGELQLKVHQFTRQFKRVLRIIKAMKITSVVLLMALSMWVCYGYDKLDSHQQIMAYYEENSFMPILHVYFNRHFSKSRQYDSFLEVIEETEFEVKSYAKILLTDCQNEKSDQNLACREIKRMNENRMIIGYQPNSKFTNFGDKVMQAPPSNRVFDQISDSYTVQQIVRFINQLVPNFFKQLRNTHQFQSFKSPKYVPKLIFAAQEGFIPQAIKQLGVQFFLKFDMAWVEDLTESIINSLEITKFPSLLVLKHNFENNKLEIFSYPSHDFSQDQADSIRKFLSTHALKQRRNDYVFHLILSPASAQIQTVDSKAEFDRTLDRIKSWVFVQQGPTYQKLVQLKDKYGLFYDYIHYLIPSTEPKITLINTRANFELDYAADGIQYRTLNAEDLHSNMTIWLKKDYVVMGVRQQYGYLCTIIDKSLFAGMAQCFIIDQDEYEKVSQNVRIKFKYGFVVSAKNQIKGTSKVNGNDIRTLEYQEIYRTLEYITKLKVKDIIDDFIQHPVKDLTGSTEVQELCAEPYKKCILYFYQSTSDKTKREYLELEAVDFVNEYKIYAVDLTCNKHMYEEIPQFKENHGGLIAFHPRLNKYVYLKAKMTRNVIRKFLEINNSDKKALPFKEFLSDQTVLNDCNETPNQQQKQQQSEQSQQERFAQEL